MIGASNRVFARTRGRAGRWEMVGMDKEERKAQAAKHNALMKGAFSGDTETTVAAAAIYEEGASLKIELPEPPFETTETMVTTAFAPEAFYRNGKGKTVVVDPASFTRPGGAYEDGAFGPEQIICSESNLYQVLCGIKESYHDKNRDYRRGQLFTDRAAYLPGVAFSRGGVRRADVIAISEPLRERALENHRSERECDNALKTRIETFLTIAAANECETLIVGAFGCGRLGYPTSQVIGVFSAWLDEHPGALGRVVFAVPRAFFDDFDAAFGRPEEDHASESEVASEEEEDEFDLSSIELPEGVTLR